MRIGSWQFGEWVQERVGGPIMAFLGLLQDGVTAVCRVLATGEIKHVLVTSLIAAVLTGIFHGHEPEALPGRPVIEKPAVEHHAIEDPPGHGAPKLPVPAVTNAASGGTAKAFGLEEEGWAPQGQTMAWGAPGWHNWHGKMVWHGDEELPFTSGG
jgi:hypothetical protein